MKRQNLNIERNQLLTSAADGDSQLTYPTICIGTVCVIVMAWEQVVPKISPNHKSSDLEDLPLLCSNVH